MSARRQWSKSTPSKNISKTKTKQMTFSDIQKLKEFLANKTAQ